MTKRLRDSDITIRVYDINGRDISESVVVRPCEKKLFSCSIQILQKSIVLGTLFELDIRSGRVVAFYTAGSVDDQIELHTRTLTILVPQRFIYDYSFITPESAEYKEYVRETNIHMKILMGSIVDEKKCMELFSEPSRWLTMQNAKSTEILSETLLKQLSVLRKGGFIVIPN